MTAVIERTVVTEPGVRPERVFTAAQIIARFMSKVDTSAGPDGCHIWTSSKSAYGYGDFRIYRVIREYAHRWALSNALGRPLVHGEYALHRCDNPPCVNPRHLYVGDQAQNSRDCMERGRANLSGLAIGRRMGPTRGRFTTGTEICGEPRDYERHLRRGEEPCVPCREASNEYGRRRYHARKAAMTTLAAAVTDQL